jgi:hypothetical protein
MRGNDTSLDTSGGNYGDRWGATGGLGEFETTVCQIILRRPPAIRKIRAQFPAGGHCARSGNWAGSMQLSPPAPWDDHA